MKNRSRSYLAGLVCALFSFGVMCTPVALAAETTPCVVEKISDEKELIAQTAHDSFGLSTENGLIKRAREPLSPSFPTSLDINGGKQVVVDLSQWHDYSFTTNSDGTAVYVATAEGTLVGAIDTTYARTNAGEVIGARLRVEQKSLIIEFANSITGTVHMEYINAAGDENLSLPSYERESFIGIPSGYVYNPAQGWAHDYCTYSPDEFNVAGNKVDFRGPCARHDMCYMKKKCRSKACDVTLRENLKTNCRVQLNALNPLRAVCLATADVYYNAVTAWQNVSGWDSMPRCD